MLEFEQIKNSHIVDIYVRGNRYDRLEERLL